MALTRNAEATAARTANSRWLEPLARSGFVGYGIAGLLVVAAAVNYDPEQARGLDATLPAQTHGQLTVVALGIAAFGLFCLLQYRKV
ncbi:DUF1206 domain-containing protein [Micromonospora deserti]|uniref:DUF1206 domain-containing protein n=1 Tax=Micromonospora deserti TaxID=2070366 RepID=A0A2W2BYC5_9ACTN|nr:DUF1206 domain-containing protein [Micromonospora deserti]PZF90620.1 hypothetical protein C1I99_24260 [Micromonospora deserti]